MGSRQADPFRGREVFGVADHQFGGHQPVAQHPALAVQVGEQRIEQPRALVEPGFETSPLLAVQEQGYGIQQPRLGRASARTDVGDAVVQHQPADVLAPRLEPRHPEAFDGVDQRLGVGHAEQPKEFVVGRWRGRAVGIEDRSPDRVGAHPAPGHETAAPRVVTAPP